MNNHPADDLKNNLYICPKRRTTMGETITKELLIAVRDGDHSAFEQLFVASFNKVKYFIKGLVKSEHDAEELAQDIFVKLYLNRASIDVNRNFSTYLYISARNATFNFIRRRNVRQSFLDEQMRLDPEIDSLEESYFAKEIDLLIKMAVACMPERRREIFELSRNKGMDNNQIAGLLKISKKTVENQLGLAVRELREIVKLLILLFS